MSLAAHTISGAYRTRGMASPPLGVRLAIALVLPLIAVTLVFGYIYLQRSRTLLRDELGREGRAITRVVQIAIEDYLRDRQLGDMHDLVDRVTGYERVLGLRIFDSQGKLAYQSSSLDPYPFVHYEVLAHVLKERQTGETRRRIGGAPVVGFLAPLISPTGQLVGAVQVLQLESFIEEDAKANRDFIVLLIVATLLATLTIVLLVTRFSITRPIEALVQSIREVGAGPMPARVHVDRNDELGWLAEEFDGMCRRLDAAQLSLATEQEKRRTVEDRLRNAERLAGLGRLAAGLAHEIGTPLNVISGRAESLRRSLEGEPETERSLRIITGQIDRIERIVRDMLDFARMKEPRRAPTDIASVVRHVLELMEAQLESARITVQFRAENNLPQIVADADRLQQVFLNLVVNAADAMPGGGVLSVAVEIVTGANPERPGVPLRCVAVRFQDTGSGIAAGDVDHVFDPFFTTKEPGRGTGLGLSVSYGIVEEHRGWFDLASEVGHGTQMSVLLPIDPDADEPPDLFKSTERGEVLST